MRRWYAITYILIAGIILCGFQQGTAPKRGEPNQENRSEAQQKASAPKQNGGSGSPSQSGAEATKNDPKGNQENNSQNMYIAAPEKTVDSVEQTISLFGAGCTLILAVVGIIGICFGWQTLKTIRREGIIMIQQSRVLQRQAAAMERQTKIAGDTAKAARDNIELLINKERPRIRIDLKPLSLKPATVYTVDFTVNVYGATAAYIEETLCVTYETPEDSINEPELGEAVMFPIHNLPSVLIPNSPPFEQYAFLLLGEHKDPVIEEIQHGRLLVGIRGFIRYRDVFDRGHETRFRYVWKLNALFGMSSEFGEWEKCGTAQENCET